jgi:hypothetical protein
MLQGGYRDVNRGSGNRTGWNSIMGRFVGSKWQQDWMEQYNGEHCG